MVIIALSSALIVIGVGKLAFALVRGISTANPEHYVLGSISAITIGVIGFGALWLEHRERRSMRPPRS